jgi:heptosyltransferase-2
MNKILIIKTHAIGDVLMTTPALRSLRTSFPRAEISVLVGNWSAPILKNNSYITRLIEFEDDIVHKKKIINLIKIVLILRSYKFDTAIIFHPSPFIHLIAMCAGIKKRYGLCRHGKSFFLTSSIEENGSYDFYYPQNFLNVLVKIGIKSKDTKMNVFSTPGDFNSVKEIDTYCSWRRLKPQRKNSGTPLAGKLFYNSCTENYKRFSRIYYCVFRRGKRHRHYRANSWRNT